MALDAASSVNGLGFNPASLLGGAGQAQGAGFGAMAGGIGLDGATPIGGPAPYAPAGQINAGGGPEGGFEGALNAIQQAEDKEQRSNALTAAYARGEDVPLHQVMEASEEASLALETLAALRNRVLDAVNELTRMQV